MDNKDLKEVYDKMHSQGSSSWFGQGEEERKLILKMGEPWDEKIILEIGCGEGNLTNLIWKKGGHIRGIDYSRSAIEKARDKYKDFHYFFVADYKELNEPYDRIVMQGVLEHLDEPFVELKWMMDNLLTEKGDVITSSPCFLNPRGIVWMTLDMIGAKMSNTDLHYLNPWEFEDFADTNKYKIEMKTCDWSWGNDLEMWQDFSKRIPLALKDGNLPFYQKKFNALFEWFYISGLQTEYGATAVYRISK